MPNVWAFFFSIIKILKIVNQLEFLIILSYKLFTALEYRQNKNIKISLAY